MFWSVALYWKKILKWSFQKSDYSKGKKDKSTGKDTSASFNYSGCTLQELHEGLSSHCPQPKPAPQLHIFKHTWEAVSKERHQTINTTQCISLSFHYTSFSFLASGLDSPYIITIFVCVSVYLETHTLQVFEWPLIFKDHSTRFSRALKKTTI